MLGENDDGFEKHLVGIIVLAILLVISLFISVYLVYRMHRLKQSRAKPKPNVGTKDDRTHVYDLPDNSCVQQAMEGTSIYTDLNRPNPGEQNDDDHVYAHLNTIPHLYENES